MSLMRLAACTAVLVALSAECASAAPALATTNVNVRQGPGTTYQIITTIPGGSTVDVTGCSGQWCQVTWQGQQGYAIATALDTGGGPPGGAPVGAPPGAVGLPPGAVPGDDVPVPAYGPPPPPAVVVVPGPYGYYGPGYGYGYRGGYYRGYGYGYRGYGYRGYGYRRW
jgi:hypothetical protein